MNDSSACGTPAAALDDCWNRVGIHGDLSCPRLVQHVHCRHCPVYAEAALDRLDRVPPPGYLEAWTGLVAQADAAAEADTRCVFLFRVGCEWLGLDAAALDEVAAARCVHALPHRREGVLRGLVNIRGKLVACIALERILRIERSDAGTERRQHGGGERMLVLVHEGERAVCVADEVYGLHRFHPSVLSAAPPASARGEAPYTHAILPWEARRAALLDSGLLFHTINRSLA
jgi:chemotaxis-related protein WspD